jgi:hypothetical protein
LMLCNSPKVFYKKGSYPGELREQNARSPLLVYKETYGVLLICHQESIDWWQIAIFGLAR